MSLLAHIPLHVQQEQLQLSAMLMLCRRPSPHEEMVLNCLQISRRNIRNFEAIEKTIKFALASEEQQFERLHFAYKKIKSDAAYLKHLERRLEQEKAKNAQLQNGAQ